MKCIALTGGKQNGKDTAAKILHDLMPGKSRDKFFHGFAWELKLEIVNMFCEEYEYEGACDTIDELKEKYPHVRKLLQDHGDYQKEKHGQNYWIDKFDNAIADILDSVDFLEDTLLIVTDLRFINELDYLRNTFVGIDVNDLLTLRIMRTPMPVGFVPDNHISETELNSIRADEVIENPWGDMPKFKANLEAALIRKGWLAGPK